MKIISVRRFPGVIPSVRAFAWLACIASGLIAVYSPAVIANDALPQLSPEGLQLQKDTKARAVYLKPEATFTQYDRVWIVDCYVQFDKDWQRDYNNQVVGIDGRVSADDMKRIEKDLAAEFKKVFTKELQDKGGYAVVNASAPDVLVLRPALINLRVNAPDLMRADMSMAVVSSAGQMTLYLELWDPVSNTILARVIDPQADSGYGAQMGGSVGNTAAADRILQDWATRLRKHLDVVHGKPADR